jgi:hypothetical protein
MDFFSLKEGETYNYQNLIRDVDEHMTRGRGCIPYAEPAAGIQSACAGAGTAEFRHPEPQVLEIDRTASCRNAGA